MKGKCFMNVENKKIITRQNLIQDISRDVNMPKTQVTAVFDSLHCQIKKHIMQTNNVTEIKIMPGVTICSTKYINKKIVNPSNGLIYTKDYIKAKAKISNYMQRLINGGNGNGQEI